MKNLIRAIQNKLQTDVECLKYIDQDWGQMDFYERPPVKFPCALIDVQNASYSNEGRLIQQCEATVLIRLFGIRLSNSSQAAPEMQKENAQKMWQLMEDVNKSLHGQNFLPTGFSSLKRTEMRKVKRRDGSYQTELFYRVVFKDFSAQRTPSETILQNPSVNLTSNS
jgi:hypothetical protein